MVTASRSVGRLDNSCRKAEDGSDAVRVVAEVQQKANPMALQDVASAWIVYFISAERGQSGFNGFERQVESICERCCGQSIRCIVHGLASVSRRNIGHQHQRVSMPLTTSDDLAIFNDPAGPFGVQVVEQV